MCENFNNKCEWSLVFSKVDTIDGVLEGRPLFISIWNHKGTVPS